MKKTLVSLSALLVGIAGAAGAQAKDLKIAFGLSLPPYVIQENNTGFELEIMQEALAAKGHKLVPVYLPLARVPVAIKDKEVDGAQRGSADLKDGTDGFYGEKAAVYKAYAISLKSSNLKVDSFADLGDKSVIAFQGASNILGADFAGAVKGNSKYQENADQKAQAMMLYTGRAQVAIADLNIFKFNSAKIADQADVKQELALHDVFAKGSDDPNPIFLDKQIRDDYNAGLAELKAKGRDKEIYAKYIKE